MATRDLWFLPKGGPGRQYRLDMEPVFQPAAAKAIALRMYRKYAAGEVDGTPAFEIVLAVSTLAHGQITRTYGITDEDVEGFLMKTAERAAACLDMRLPPPVEPEVPRGFVVWFSTAEYASEKMLTHTLLTAVG